MAALAPSPRLAVRKRAILCLGHLVMSCDQTLYIKLINMLLEELAKSGNTSSTRTYIQALGAVCRQAGHRSAGGRGGSGLGRASKSSGM